MSREQSEFLIENMAALRALRHGNGQLLNGERFALASFIADKTRDGEFYWGDEKLAAATGVNPTDVTRHLRVFRDAGALTDRGMQSRGKYRSVKVWEVHFHRLLGEAPTSPSPTPREVQREAQREAQGEVQGEVSALANPCTDSLSTLKPKPKHETKPPTISVKESAAELDSPEAASTVGPRATEVTKQALDIELALTRNVRNPEGFRHSLRPIYAPIVARLIYQYPDLTDEELAQRAHQERNGITATRSAAEQWEERWQAAERRKQEAAEAEAQEEPARPETIAEVRSHLNPTKSTA